MPETEGVDRERERELALCRYIQAFDQGDLDGLADAIAQAEDDPELDRQIMAVNETLHAEVGLPTSAEAHPERVHTARSDGNGEFVSTTAEAGVAFAADASGRLPSSSQLNNGSRKREDHMGASRPRFWMVWHWRLAAAATVMVLLLGSVLATPAGRAVATELLGQFRVQKFALITVMPRDPSADFASLEQLGTLHVPEHLEGAPDEERGRTEASAAAAGERAGFAVLQPSHLPAGLSASPQARTTPASAVSFTVDREKALAYLAEQGHSDIGVPVALDGATIHLAVPAAVLLLYDDEAGQPSLIVGQSPGPTVSVSGGATLEQFRSFLLSVPGLPPDTVAQLRAIDDWTRTMPIPVPLDAAVSRHVTVAGAPGVSVQDAQTRHGGILWQRDGMVYGVGGSYGEQELLSVAASLQ